MSQRRWLDAFDRSAHLVLPPADLGEPERQKKCRGHGADARDDARPAVCRSIEIRHDASTEIRGRFDFRHRARRVVDEFIEQVAG
jgi:hypothetical protein